MENVNVFFSECEAHIDRYIDYAPIFNHEVLAATQLMITKVERIYQNENLKNVHKSQALYIQAGLYMIKNSNTNEIEQNLLKSVQLEDKNEPRKS